MKQVEKLDRILKGMYNRRTLKEDVYLDTICELDSIPLVSVDELHKLADRLEGDNYIECTRIQAGIYAQLTSYGVEYCEEDSYSFKGHSIITNNNNYFTISDSPFANIVSDSNNVKILANNYGELKSKFTELKEKIIGDATISESQKAEILECIEEVQDSVDAGKKPKFSFRQLTEQASNISGVSSLLLQIGQMLFAYQA